MCTINISTPHRVPWLRQFPNQSPEWGGYKFIFNADDQPYDYLVAFDDLHEIMSPKCPVENTIHITTEPQSVFAYHRKFTDQFGWLLTHVKHAYRNGVIQSPPLLNWYIGWQPDAENDRGLLSYEQMEQIFFEEKTKNVSIVTSNKAFTEAHRKRIEFAKRLKANFGNNLDFFGRGFVSMDDKLESLRDYRFHIAIENSSYDGYFTEKITDCFLAGTYPIYYGCKNLDQYFPKNSFLQIDLEDYDASISLIKTAISERYDLKYKAELKEARDLCLTYHNTFPALVRIIEQIKSGERGQPASPQLHGKVMLPFGSKKFRRLRIKRRPHTRLLFFIETMLSK